jgi:hypothetical protein
MAQRGRMDAGDPIGIGSGRREELRTLVRDMPMPHSDAVPSSGG